MTKNLHVRVSDHANLLMDKDNGFYARKRTPIEQIIFVLSFMGFVGLGTAAIVYYDSLTGVYICGTLGAVLFVVGKQVEVIKSLLHVSDFMNALFSSVVAKKSKFTAIVKLSGDVVYFNRPFQELFPQFVAQDKRKLETLLALAGASIEHTGAALTALSNNQETRVNVILNLGNHKTAEPISLSFEPIERPTGFVLIRGE